MRWLANENIPGVAVGALRGAGFDVAWMRDLAPGADDEQVLAIARDQQRLVEILTGRDDWHDRFAVVDEERVRLRRMPR